jgi:hypothetical protein
MENLSDQAAARNGGKFVVGIAFPVACPSSRLVSASASSSVSARIFHRFASITKRRSMFGVVFEDWPASS